MQYRERLAKVLHTAESELRSLMDAATKEPDYEAVVDLAAVAAQLRRLAPPAETTERVTRAAPRFASAERKYPLFTRNREELIKTGWSSTSRSEYQHRAPIEVLLFLAGKLEEFRKSAKGRFSMESVLPLTLPPGRQVPDYQAYLCLAWLREIQLVKKDGRTGYLVMGKKSVPAVVEAALEETTSEGDTSR